MTSEFKSIARRVFLSALGSFSKIKPGTYFLNGHYVTSEKRSVNEQIDIFEKQLKDLLLFCDFVSPEEALANLHQKSSCLISFTFDDGFSDNLSIIAPVTERFNTRCLFFVNPDFLDLPDEQAVSVLQENYLLDFHKSFLTKEQLFALSQNGHTIGSHTSSHVRLNIEDEDILNDQIVRCRKDIESITNKVCNTFAHPFGGMNNLSEKALQTAFRTYDHVFASTVHNRSFEYNGRVINRRHAEGNWPVSHIKYFLSRRS